MTPSRHISRVIRTSPQAVYDYAADPRHLHEWAAGVAEAAVTVHDETSATATSPMGEVVITFVPRNSLVLQSH